MALSGRHSKVKMWELNSFQELGVNACNSSDEVGTCIINLFLPLDPFPCYNNLILDNFHFSSSQFYKMANGGR